MEDQKKVLVLLLTKPHILELLRELFAESEYSLTQTDLAYRVGILATSLQKDLAKMESLNLISTSKGGRNIYYKVEKDNAFPAMELMVSIEKVAEHLSLKHYKKIRYGFNLNQK